MARTYEIAFKLGAQMAGNFAKTMSSATGSLGELNSKIGQLNKQQSAISSLVKLRTAVANNSREYMQARERVSKLAREIQNTTNPSKELTREFEKAKRQASQLKGKLTEKRTELIQLNRTMGTTGQSTADLVRRQKDLAASAEKARKAQANLQSAMAARDANIAKRGQLRGQLFDTVALAAALGAPIKVAMEFEQSMAKVGAVSRASDAELKSLTKTARNLGATTNWSASQAADGMQFLAMAGFNTEQTIAAMPGMLDLASAGAIDLGSAADIASNILSGFNMEASEMGRLGDVMTNTFTSSNTSLSMLGESMKYVAPIAAATGISIEQASAMVGKLGDAGIQGSKAGTSLRTVISRLAAPAGKAASVLEELGVQTQDASGNLRAVPDILADMNKAMASFGNATRAEMTSSVFGLEAASAATVLLGQAGSGNLQAYAEKLTEVGSATRVANKQNETAAGAMKRLASATESIGITIGSVLLPPLATLADAMAKVFGIIGAGAEKFPFLTKVIVMGTAALIAFKIAAIAGAYAFTFIRGAWLTGVVALRTLQASLAIATLHTKALSFAQTAAAIKMKVVTAAQWLWNAALTANPIGLIIVAVGALIAAGVALYKNWDKVTAFFGAAWQKMKALVMAFNPLSWMMAGFTGLTSWLSGFSLFSSGKKILETMAAGIRAAIGAPIKAIKGALSAVRKYLPFSDAKIGPLSELTKSGQAILTTLGDGMNKVGVTDVMAPFKNMFGKGMDMVGLGGVADAFRNDPNLNATLDTATGQLNRTMTNNGAGAGGSSGVTLSLTQHITVGNGAGGNVEQQARNGAAAGADDMIDQLKKAMNQERRLSYA
ncbi:MAG: phage tail tape measure protein [Methyloprofundus sp.]|nr:phage tail tape measure protein [Methyloprofundus sp.]